MTIHYVYMVPCIAGKLGREFNLAAWWAMNALPN